ncbi:unnamed protein product, partial [Heterosigma akashiwo]
MHEALDADLKAWQDGEERLLIVKRQQLEAATLTVDPKPQGWGEDPQAGGVIAALLPHFTKEEDREV